MLAYPIKLQGQSLPTYPYTQRRRCQLRPSCRDVGPLTFCIPRSGITSVSADLSSMSSITHLLHSRAPSAIAISAAWSCSGVGPLTSCIPVCPPPLASVWEFLAHLRDHSQPAVHVDRAAVISRDMSHRDAELLAIWIPAYAVP